MIFVEKVSEVLYDHTELVNCTNVVRLMESNTSSQCKIDAANICAHSSSIVQKNWMLEVQINILAMDSADDSFGTEA